MIEIKEQDEQQEEQFETVSYFKLPNDLKMSTSAYKPNFQIIPHYYWSQTVCQRFICVFIVVFIVALWAVLTFVLVLWTSSTSSTTFALLWFSLGMGFFIIITIINSFSKPPALQIDNEEELQQTFQKMSFANQISQDSFILKIQ